MIFRDNLIPKIPNDFVYIIVFLLIVFVSTRILRAKSGHIFALLTAWYIIKNLQEKVDRDDTEFHKEMDRKLEKLGNPSHFYMDVNFITLFYSFYGWKNINNDNYASAIKACNNLLKIESDSEKKLQRCVDNYQIAVSQSKIALNMIHGFIYSVEQKIMVNKLKNILKRLQQLLARHLNKIKENCEQTESEKPNVDVNTGYIQDSDFAKPHDPHVSQFDFY